MLNRKVELDLFYSIQYLDTFPVWSPTVAELNCVWVSGWRLVPLRENVRPHLDGFCDIGFLLHLFQCHSEMAVTVTQCRYESGQTPFQDSKFPWHLPLFPSRLFPYIHPPNIYLWVVLKNINHIQENEMIKTFVQKMFTVICQSLHSQWSICSRNRINVYFDCLRWDIHMLPLEENVLIPCYILLCIITST